MMKKDILLITTTYKTGEKMYPIVPKLSNMHNVDVLNLYEMSKYTDWPWRVDLRAKFYAMCDDLGLSVMHAPGVVDKKNINVKVYEDYFRRLGDVVRKHYDLVILDNNMQDKKMGWNVLYKFFADRNMMFIGSPHGNREYHNYNVMKRIGHYYDYSFIFGEKEKRKIFKKERKYKGNINKLIPAGIPSNDALKKYSRGKKYILIIPNFTKKPPKQSKSRHFSIFTLDLFEKLRIHKLSEEYNCPIIIKEKHRLFYEDDSVIKIVNKYKNIVNAISVSEDDNRLISDSLFVITAPSTLAFKPIQAGIPTVMLRGHGMIGNFFDFPGLVDPNKKSVRETIKLQMECGRLVDFIGKTLSGGVEYNSIDLYIDNINKILEKVDV